MYSVELHAMVMVRALVKLRSRLGNEAIQSKETTEALFNFFQVISYWLMMGMKYVHGQGRD